jgi:hypothetical protein
MIDLVLVATIVHVLIGLQKRFAAANAGLVESNRDLAAREEEIARAERGAAGAGGGAGAAERGTAGVERRAAPPRAHARDAAHALALAVGRHAARET